MAYNFDDLQKKIEDSKNVDDMTGSIGVLPLSVTEGKIIQINPVFLVDYRNHPFKPWSEKKKAEIKASVEVMGIIEPCIVREIFAGKYEVLAGHNRRDLAKELGITVPCKVVQVSDVEAEHIMLATNIMRRAGDEETPSERSELYKRLYDNTIELYKEKGEEDGAAAGAAAAIAEISKQTGKSEKTIYRYMELQNLTERNLQRLDSGEISLTTGIELAHLDTEQQEILADYESEKGYILGQAEIKKLTKVNFENAADIDETLNKKKVGRPKKEKPILSFVREDFIGIKGLPESEIELKMLILKLLRERE